MKCPYCKLERIDFLKTEWQDYVNGHIKKFFLIICPDCEKIIKSQTLVNYKYKKEDENESLSKF